MEENGNAENVNVEQANSNQEQQSTQSQPQIQDLGIADALKGLIPQDELEAISGIQNKVEGKKPEQTATTGQKPENAEAKKPEGEKEKETPEGKAPEVKKEETKSVLGLGKKKDNSIQNIVIEKPEQILDVIKTKFGQEYKGIDELPKFFESANKWRADSQNLEKLKQEHENVTEILSGLPSEFIDGIKKYYNGENYLDAFKNTAKFDFSVPAEKQDVKELVNHYFPGKFADEDFELEEKPETLLMAIDLSKDKYNITKQSLDNKRAEIEAKAELQLQATKQSINGSVNYLKQSFPDVDQDVTQEISSVLEGGINKIAEMFLNTDGTVKPEAAEMLLMAKYGKSEISKMMDIASHTTETRINEEIVTRSADTAKPVKGAPRDMMSDDVMKQIQELGKLQEKSTY
jgi:hypothetical protein